MAYIEWTSKMSTGMKDIDDQHKHFFSLINKAHDASEAGAPRSAQKEVIMGLIEYVRYHFGTEEDYFDKFRYPHADEHKAEHAELIAKVLALSDKYENGGDIAPELFAFIRKWLIDHIMKQDMKYAKYFKANGYV